MPFLNSPTISSRRDLRKSLLIYPIEGVGKFSNTCKLRSLSPCLTKCSTMFNTTAYVGPNALGKVILCQGKGGSLHSGEPPLSWPAREWPFARRPFLSGANYVSWYEQDPHLVTTSVINISQSGDSLSLFRSSYAWSCISTPFAFACRTSLSSAVSSSARVLGDGLLHTFFNWSVPTLAVTL